MTIKIRNKSKRLVEVNLDHDLFKKDIEHRSVVFDPTTGVNGVKISRVKIFPSMIFLGGETKDIDENVLLAPSFKAAVDSGQLRAI